MSNVANFSIVYPSKLKTRSFKDDITHYPFKRVSLDIQCPQSHVLSYANYKFYADKYRCEICSGYFKCDAGAWRCHQCKFDLCVDCYAKRLSGKFTADDYKKNPALKNRKDSSQQMFEGIFRKVLGGGDPLVEKYCGTKPAASNPSKPSLKSLSWKGFLFLQENSLDQKSIQSLNSNKRIVLTLDKRPLLEIFADKVSMDIFNQIAGQKKMFVALKSPESLSDGDLSDIAEKLIAFRREYKSPIILLCNKALFDKTSPSVSNVHFASSEEKALELIADADVFSESSEDEDEAESSYGRFSVEISLDSPFSLFAQKVSERLSLRPEKLILVQNGKTFYNEVGEVGALFEQSKDILCAFENNPRMFSLKQPHRTNCVVQHSFKDINLRVSGDAEYQTFIGTEPLPKGNYYWEVHVDNDVDCLDERIIVGVCTKDMKDSVKLGEDSHGYGYQPYSGIVHSNITSEYGYVGEIPKDRITGEFGVFLDTNSRTISFLNGNTVGENLGVAFEKLPETIYPALTILKPEYEAVITNFWNGETKQSYRSYPGDILTLPRKGNTTFKVNLSDKILGEFCVYVGDKCYCAKAKTTVIIAGFVLRPRRMCGKILAYNVPYTKDWYYLFPTDTVEEDLEVDEQALLDLNPRERLQNDLLGLM